MLCVLSSQTCLIMHLAGIQFPNPSARGLVPDMDQKSGIELTRANANYLAPRPSLLDAVKSASPARPQGVSVILWAGLLAGSLDGLDAIVSVWFRGIRVARLFQYIASGLLGVQAFRGGRTTVVLGCLLHFLIAFVIAGIYFALSVRLPFLRRSPLICGPIYGLAVFIVMHYIVVPLSGTPPQPAATPSWIANQLFSHVFFVGFPIALTMSWTQPVVVHASGNS